MRAAWVVLVALGLVGACAVQAEAMRIGPIRPLTKQERVDDLVQCADAIVVATLGDRVRFRERRMFGGSPETFEIERVVIHPRRTLKGPALPTEIAIEVCPTHPVSEFRTDLPYWPAAVLALQRPSHLKRWEHWAPAFPMAGGHPYLALVADSTAVIAEVESAIRRQSLDSLAIEADYIGVLREESFELVQQVVETIAGEWPANGRRLARVIPIPRPGLKLVFGRYTEDVTWLPGGPVWIEPLHMGAGEMEIVDGIVQPLNQPLDSVILRIRMLRLAHGRPAPRAARH